MHYKSCNPAACLAHITYHLKGLLFILESFGRRWAVFRLSISWALVMTVSHIYAHRRERSEPPTYSFCSLTTYSIAHTHTHTHTQLHSQSCTASLRLEADTRPHTLWTHGWIQPPPWARSTAPFWSGTTVICCDPRGYHWWRDQTFGFLTSTDSKLKTTQITPHSSSDKINKLKSV